MLNTSKSKAMIRRELTLSWIQRVCVTSILWIGIACSDTAFAPPIEDLTSAYWSLRINYQAVQLSTYEPYNSLQLVAIPLAADGAVFTAEGTSGDMQQFTAWSSNDSSKVKVSQSGLITAVEETNDTRIEVRHTIGEVTHVDIVRVVVKDLVPLPKLAEFSIRPTDSLKRAAGYVGWYSFPVIALDTAGQQMSGIPIRWRSSNVKIAAFYDSNLGMLSAFLPSNVMVSASTWIYGVEKSDSFTLEIGWPVFWANELSLAEQVVTSIGSVVLAPSGLTTEMGPGGRASFLNRTGFGPRNVIGKSPLDGVSIDVVFDDPSVALPAGNGWIGDTSGIGGNIIGLKSDTTVAAWTPAFRRFIKPGKHFFTVQPLGYRGSIYVHDK